MHVVTMLSYANSMLNPLLYAAFNENLRAGFARACRCIAGGHGTAAGRTTGGGGGSGRGHRMLASNAATDLGPRRPPRCGDDRRPVAGQRLEVVEVVAVSSRFAATVDEVMDSGDLRHDDDEDNTKYHRDAVAAKPTCQPLAVVVAVSSPPADATDRSVEETPL